MCSILKKKLTGVINREHWKSVHRVQCSFNRTRFPVMPQKKKDRLGSNENDLLSHSSPIAVTASLVSGHCSSFQDVKPTLLGAGLAFS